MYEILQKIAEKRATLADLHILETLAPMVKETSLCGLGQSAPNPVLSTLRFFREEYLELIESSHNGKVPVSAERIDKS